MTDKPVTDDDALRSDVGAVVIERDAVAVRGPDALTFLQGQLSQDLAAVAVGTSVDSLLLQPTGRMVALLRVTRTADDEFVLDTDGGAGPLVLERLGPLQAAHEGRSRAARLGAAWPCGARGPMPWRPTACPPTGRGGPASTCSGPPSSPRPACRRARSAAYEALRIEMGVPRTGAELDERTIPERGRRGAEGGQLQQGLLHGSGAGGPHRQPGRQRAPPAAPPRPGRGRRPRAGGGGDPRRQGRG